MQESFSKYDTQLTPKKKINRNEYNNQFNSNHSSPQHYRNQKSQSRKGATKYPKQQSKTSQNFHYHRNMKSLKILNIHLKQYKQLNEQSINKNVKDDLDTIFNAAMQRDFKNASILGKNSIVFKNSNDKNQQNMANSLSPSISSMDKKQSLQLPFFKNLESQLNNISAISPPITTSPSKVFKPFQNKAQPKVQNFMQKCQAVIDSLLLNLGIFKKVYSNTKKKRTVISKLYGWDPLFLGLFFIRYGQNNYSQQFKQNISKQSIIQELGLDKKNFNSQNIYNKLRLFLAELSNANIKHQQIQSNNKKNKLLMSSSKLRNSLQKLTQQSFTKQSTRRQIDIMRQTHVDMIKMKMRIKNKGQQIQKISQGLNGGSTLSAINVHPFYLKEEKNVAEIETFINGIMRK